MMKLKRQPKAEPKVAIKEDVSELVEQELAEEGIVMFDNTNVDEDYLQLPADLTEVESRELGRYFNAFTQQKMYVRTVVGRLGAIIRERDGEINILRAEVYSSLPPKVSQREKELLFQSDERVQEQLREIFHYEEKLKMARDYLEGLIDGITLISREISRREADWNDDKRNDNLNRKR